MPIIKIAMPILAVMFLTACASKPTPSPMPTPSPDMMSPPCQLQAPSSDADTDLAIDVQNAECTRQLRLRVFRLQDWVRNATGLPAIK